MLADIRLRTLNYLHCILHLNISSNIDNKANFQYLVKKKINSIETLVLFVVKMTNCLLWTLKIIKKTNIKDHIHSVFDQNLLWYNNTHLQREWHLLARSNRMRFFLACLSILALLEHAHSQLNPISRERSQREKLARLCFSFFLDRKSIILLYRRTQCPFPVSLEVSKEEKKETRNLSS